MYHLLRQITWSFGKSTVPGSYHRPTESPSMGGGVRNQGICIFNKHPQMSHKLPTKSESDGTRISFCSISDPLCSQNDRTVLWPFQPAWRKATHLLAPRGEQPLQRLWEQRLLFCPFPGGTGSSMQIKHVHTEQMQRICLKRWIKCILIFKIIALGYITIFRFQKTNRMCSKIPNSGINSLPINFFWCFFFFWLE